MHRRAATPALLVLEDGRTFRGESYGAEGETFGEAVFSTGMTGYQETLTDPSYHRQVVVMTAPHVGNTGMNDEDPESRRIWVSGYVVRDPSRVASSWRSQRTLDDQLREQGVVGISGVDTRALTRHLRERGAMRVGISTTTSDPESLLTPGPRVRGDDRAGARRRRHHRRAVRRARGLDRLDHESPRWTVAAVDLGLKANTPRMMAERGIETHVLPATASIDDVLAVGADGLFFSNGPGDPAATTAQVELLQAALERGIPYFGICFGNQLFGRALGFGTYKLQLRPPRHQPAGHGPHHRQGRGHRAQPRLRRRRPARPGHRDAVRQREREPRLPQRRRRGGAGAARRGGGAQGVLGPVPPRGRRRPPRRRLPLRPLRRPDAPSEARRWVEEVARTRASRREAVDHTSPRPVPRGRRTGGVSRRAAASPLQDQADSPTPQPPTRGELTCRSGRTSPACW